MSIKEELHRLVDTLSERELLVVVRLLRSPSLPDRIELPTLIAQQRFTPLTDPLALAEGIWPESYVLKRDTRAQRYLPYLTGTIVVISFMSLAELERWAIERNWGVPRRTRLRQFLDTFVTRPVDRALCEAWAAIMVEARRAGRLIAHADAWIAATARVDGLPLVTNNVRHYAGVSGLQLITGAMP
jgi:predicted nucleic acid-binding protein